MITEHNVGPFTHLERESAVISRSPPKTAHKKLLTQPSCVLATTLSPVLNLTDRSWEEERGGCHSCNLHLLRNHPGFSTGSGRGPYLQVHR